MVYYAERSILIVVYYLITCRSLTYAQKVARALDRAGITATILRTPQGISREGCSYCVKVSERRGALALRVLNETDTSYNRVYIQHSDGSTREVAL